jgi:hypothetical protein
MLQGMKSSFPWLSLSGIFRRKWHSLYKALEQGEIDANWVTSYLTQQVPQAGICHFSLDGTGWPARKPKVRGIPPGWLKGRRRSPKERFSEVKKLPNPA